MTFFLFPFPPSLFQHCPSLLSLGRISLLLHFLDLYVRKFCLVLDSGFFGGVNEDVSFTLYNIQITGRIMQKQASPYHILHF